MKKITLILFFGILLITAAGQVRDTVLTEVVVANLWQNYSRKIITYNGECAVSNTLSQTWDINTKIWSNSNQNSYRYDNAGNLMSFVSQAWDVITGSWINKARTLIQFKDAFHKITMQQEWNNDKQLWMNTSKYSIIYNSSGNVMSSQTDVYIHNGWEHSSLSTILYDATSRMREVKIRIWQKNDWVNSSRTVFTYDANGLAVNYYWDNDAQSWIKSSRDINEYLAGTYNVQKTRSQYFDGVAWQNTFRTEYAYRLYHDVYKQTTTLSQQWDAVSLRWTNFFNSYCEYFNDGAPRFYTFQLWDGATTGWKPVYRNTYTHNSVCQLDVSIAQFTSGQETNKSSRNEKSAAFNYDTNIDVKDGHTLRQDFIIAAPNAPGPVKQLSFQILLISGAKNNKAIIASTDEMQTAGSDLTISPNPAQSYFNLSTSKFRPGSVVEMRLSDMSGKTILQQKLIAGSTQKIALPSLSKGLYMVTIISGKQAEGHKLVVE